MILIVIGVTALVVLAALLLGLMWRRGLFNESARRKAVEARLLTIFHNMPVGAVMFDLVDKDDHFKNPWYMSNQRFTELTGYTDEELATLGHWMERAYPDEQYRQWVWENWDRLSEQSVQDGTYIKPCEYRVTCKDGHVADMEIAGYFLGDRFVATFIDNTERNRTVEQLLKPNEQADAASHAKSTFLANMSHELRTPLNAVLGFAALLGRDADATAGQMEKLDIIVSSGEHLLSMINDILDLSKIEAGQVGLRASEFDLKALVAEISEMMRSRAGEKGLGFRLDADDIGLPYLCADVGKLRQILLNLLSNAVKFTREGEIQLRCRTEPLPDEPSRCHVLLEVADTGPGIPASMQARIFEPFVQGVGVATRKGTGLGLSISRNLVELMGGTIALESAEGEGSLFRVRLPAAIVESAPATASVQVRPRVIGIAPGQGPKRILVVDDSLENRLVLKALLEGVGFLVSEAANGREALRAVDEESPDFVWMDMRMPEMDGYEAARRLRQRPNADALPVVALTASAFSEQRPDILAAGCDDMVAKPYQEHEIFDVMARFLNLEYVYQDQGASGRGNTSGDGLTASMLAEIPHGLRQDLAQTTLVLDVAATLDVILRIEEQSPDTARHLRALTEGLRMARIQQLLNEVEA